MTYVSQHPSDTHNAGQPKTDRTPQAGRLKLSELYGTVESIRVINIAENTINLTPLNINIPTILPNSLHAKCDILINVKAHGTRGVI